MENIIFLIFKNIFFKDKIFYFVVIHIWQFEMESE